MPNRGKVGRSITALSDKELRGETRELIRKMEKEMREEEENPDEFERRALEHLARMDERTAGLVGSNKNISRKLGGIDRKTSYMLGILIVLTSFAVGAGAYLLTTL